MLPTITKIYNRSDFTIQLPLAEGYDGQEFRFTIYTCGEIENGWVASYIDGVYTNCSVDNGLVIIYVNNNNQMNPGCVTVQSEYDYFNTHFIDNEDNVKDVYKTNIYLVSYKTNAFSAQFRPSNLPDLTGSSEYVTLSYLTTTLEDYVTDEELQSQLEDFVTEEDFAAELSNYITDEELTDMGFVTQSYIDNMDLVTKSYLSDKLSTKQNILVSGVNIKTINGYTLLGSGNIDITDAGSIDLSYYVTYDYLSSQSYVTSYDVSDFVTQQDVQNILVDGAYVTSNELSNMGYVTYQFLDQASYVTQNELSQMGYVTQSQLSANSYITINDVPIIDTSSYVTHTELNNAGYVDGTYVADYVSQHAPTPDLSAYVTKSQLNQELGSYVTKTELSDAGYLTVIPSEYITDTELSSMGYITEAALGDYVTETELSQAGYLTSIPSEYVTQSQLSANSYVTESEIAAMGYITDTELSNVLFTASYVTQNELSNAGYITNSDLSQASYVTQQALSGMGYITTIPSEYVTDTELSNMGYVTQTNLSAMSYATTTQLSSKQDTLVSGTNIKTINNESLLGSGNIDIQAGGTPDYSHVLTFTGKQNSSWVRLSPTSNAPTISIQYSTDNGATWTEYSIGNSISLNNNATVKFKGKNTTISNSSGNYKFVMGGKIAASGDVTSLLNEVGGDFSLPSSCFKYLFYNCQVLTTAPNLPSTTISDSCYEQMFYNCILIEEAPELPSMTAPASCYKYMFQSCTALKKAPKLPATTLGDMCYGSMFYGCTSLEEAPELPATALTSTNYYAMFNGCTSLRYVKAMILTGLQTQTFNWVGGVAATGVFVMNANASWDPEQYRGSSGIPSGWTVYTTVALDTNYVPDSYVEDEGKTLQVVNGLWTKVTGGGGGGDMSAYVTKTELSAMSYATTTQLSTKQDTLVSGTNIKTINNTSLLGSGNLTITGGSSISEVTQAEYDAMEQAGTLDPDTLYIITDAQSADLDDYATLTYLETYYASQAYVVNYVATYAPIPDLSAYVTKTELNNASYVTKTELNNASYVSQTSLSNNGYLTSANFIYDSTTNSLTISI